MISQELSDESSQSSIVPSPDLSLLSSSEEEEDNDNSLQPPRGRGMSHSRFCSRGRTRGRSRGHTRGRGRGRTRGRGRGRTKQHTAAGTVPITALPTPNDPDMAVVTVTPFAPSCDPGSYAACDPDHVHTPLEFLCTRGILS